MKFVILLNFLLLSGCIDISSDGKDHEELVKNEQKPGSPGSEENDSGVETPVDIVEGDSVTPQDDVENEGGDPVVDIPELDITAEPVTIGPVPITQGSDDGYSWGHDGIGSSWINHELDLENLRFGGAGNQSRDYVISLLFRQLDVPSGANITSAKLIFSNQSYQNDIGNISLKIQALDPVSSVTFSGSNMAQNRAALPATVNWSKSSVAVESIDISVLVQSIVNDGNWGSGGAMSFKISNAPGSNDNIRHNLYAFDAGIADQAPQLIISYGGSVVEQNPVDPENTGVDEVPDPVVESPDPVVESPDPVVEGPSPGEMTPDTVEAPEEQQPVLGPMDIVLNWLAPTRLEDESDLNEAEITSYTLHWGETASDLTHQTTLIGNKVTSYVFEGMAAGDYYFAVSASTVYGQKSVLSNIVHRVVE